MANIDYDTSNGEKEIREKVANEISSNLKAVMENLCALGRDGYDKVESWHKGFIDQIKTGK
jgi:hypothetical protein